MGSGQSKKFKELEAMAEKLRGYGFKYEGVYIVPINYNRDYESYMMSFNEFNSKITEINDFVKQWKLMPIMKNMSNRTLTQTLPHYYENVVMASGKKSLLKVEYDRRKKESETSNLKNGRDLIIGAFNGGKYKTDNLEEAITEDNGRKRSPEAVGIIREYLEEEKSRGKVPKFVKRYPDRVVSQQAERWGDTFDESPPYYKIQYVDSPDVERKKIDDKISSCKAYIAEHEQRPPEGLQGGKRRRRHKNTKRRHKKAKKTRRR